jgi:hypothetical protein
MAKRAKNTTPSDSSTTLVGSGIAVIPIEAPNTPPPFRFKPLMTVVLVNPKREAGGTEARSAVVPRLFWLSPVDV